MGYAHARIEDHDTGKVYDRGDRVPAKLAGLEELRKAGSVRDEPYAGDPVLEAANEARIAELKAELKQLQSGDAGTATDGTRK